MAIRILLVVSSIVQLGCGQQPQLVTQFLNPSQAASMSLPPQAGQSGVIGLMGGSTSSLGQILFNLLNYKLQWLNQVAGHLTGNPVAPVKPESLQIGHSQGFPFMTTLVTTLSGNSPTIPGITISGAPVNHLAGPGVYPGAPTAAPPQDFHWIPVAGQAPPPTPPAPALPPSQETALPPATQLPQPPQAPPVQSPVAIPVIPAVDDIPAPAPPATLQTTTTTTPKPAKKNS